MAVHFICDQPSALLNMFIERVSQTEIKGKITTWRPDPSGRYYTHTSGDQHGKAWFKPNVPPSGDRLTFNIVNPEDTLISSYSYAYYHGHLIETFLNHFDEAFLSGVSSALPESGDRVRP